MSVSSGLSLYALYALLMWGIVMQDLELLLQEYYLYRCALVVPDLRWLVFGLVSVLFTLLHELRD